MSKIINIMNHLRKNTLEYRKNYLRRKLIDFFNSNNQDGVNIPAFQLAESHIKRIEAEGSINYWYKRLIETR